MISTKKAKRLFVSNLEFINQVISSAARKKKFTGSIKDDFEAFVDRKLLENDFHKIRQIKNYNNELSVKSYLSTMINRLAIDFANKTFGSYKPLLDKAGKIGRPAVIFAKLLHEHNMPFDEAARSILIEFNSLFQLNLKSEQCLKNSLAKKILLKLRKLKSAYLYTERELNDKLLELIDKRRLRDNRSKIEKCLKIFLSKKMIEEWDIVKKSNTAEYIIQDSPLTPSENIIEEEFERTIIQFRRMMQRIISDIPKEDWLIFKMRRQDGVKINLIEKTFNKSRYKINTILTSIIDRFKKELISLNIDDEDMEKIISGYDNFEQPCKQSEHPAKQTKNV